ncbi:hypothetical protein I5M47_20130 [Pseudomonas aeruginosa]|nr:hypothetical protein [Pseudomonas aeruginosa]MBH4124178.1 hypothetical protein [Pseudomonas aeruginosa]MBH9135751.1 hypothetical protein [Pseudomonas aeruginosa]MBH9337708.1 hypothetical protein [Pseudomonas aeruginosa]
MTKANECTCPSGDGSLAHPCPAHPAPVEQAGGDERDLQAEGAQEAPSPVSQEYDRHLISLLRKGEALPGHQEEAADEIERLRDWNDHLNNTVLPNILNPNFLMLMKGGERLLDLCTKDGKFIGVSLNDMKDVFDWMVTHARIAPDHAALAQPSPKCATCGDTGQIVVSGPHYCGQFQPPEYETEPCDMCAQPSPAQAEVERPEVIRVPSCENSYGFGYVDGSCHVDLRKYRNHLEDILDSLPNDEPLMTVSQHDRIVGELRADRDSWAEQAEQRLADWDEMRKERDAALVRVEQQERTIAGMNEAHAKLAGLYEAAKAQHSVPEGWRIERSAERIVVMNLKNGAGYAAARDGESGIAESVLYLLAADLLAAAPGKEVGHE